IENINYIENYSDPYSSNSNSEFAIEIENFSILNFDVAIYQDIKNKILQQNSENENEDYDLNNATKENISSEFDEEVEEIILDQTVKTINTYLVSL
ncbi:1028_t:CDS:1, partial [Racocetra persica]